MRRQNVTFQPYIFLNEKKTPPRSASETSEGEVKADALRAQVKALIGQGRRAEAEALATAQEGAFQGQAKAKVVLAAVEAWGEKQVTVMVF